MNETPKQIAKLAFPENQLEAGFRFTVLTDIATETKRIEALNAKYSRNLSVHVLVKRENGTTVSLKLSDLVLL